MSQPPLASQHRGTLRPMPRDPKMISIDFNGMKYQVEPDTPLSKLLEAFKFSKRFCAVEINEEILPKNQYDTYLVKPGDKIEVVTLVGGG